MSDGAKLELFYIPWVEENEATCAVCGVPFQHGDDLSVRSDWVHRGCDD